jgi:arginase
VQIGILGVPLDLGANRRGTDMGPSAIRYAGLAEILGHTGHAVKEFGNLPAPVAGQFPGGDSLKYLTEIVAVCTNLAETLTAVMDEGCFPVVLGGDHSVALGSIAAVGRRLPEVGLLWLDAHGDFNVPQTSRTGNIHGMPLAAIVGRGAGPLVDLGGTGPKVRESHAVLVGARDLDEPERVALRESAVTVFTMKEIDELGIAAVMRQAVEVASGGGVRPLHLSLDMDVVDPLYAPGVGTPVDGGLSFREAHLAMELISQSRALRSMEVVEVNPILDQENRTGRLAAGLVASALGKRIL